MLLMLLIFCMGQKVLIGGNVCGFVYIYIYTYTHVHECVWEKGFGVRVESNIKLNLDGIS